ncbi:PLxRFG domain-containing protein [Rhizobium sp. 18065]|uniref:PLxRFG domain-containing protein n=1 Tax=Rhizobium sp. 18065 TaxID=2681411 RepID=UPI001356B7BF|nr:PLxRFG domain-containing protein [Rhizobium sp. 18065]
MPIVIGLGNDTWNDPLNIYGGSAPAPTSAPAAPPPRKIDMPDTDRRDLVNTMIAEAAAEGETGMAAVANVIKNRADRRGKSPADIVREPAQFTGYSAPGPAAVKAMEDPALRQKAESILDSVLAGELPDVTDGADHYHAKSVNPAWASAMPRTKEVGNHLFYRAESGPDTKKRMPTYDELAGQPGLSGEITDPFDAVLKGDGSATKPKGRGMADLLPDDQFETADPASFTSLLSKLQPGKPETYIRDMSDGLRGGLTSMFDEAPDFVKAGLDILSGARSPKRQAEIIAENAGKYGFDREAWVQDVNELGPVEAGKKWRPQFRELGLTKNIGMPGTSKHQEGTAADLGWKGGKFANAPKEVREWVHENATRYDLTFPMGHEPWHIETASARSGGSAEAVASAPTAPKQLGETIVIDEGFTSSDPMGLMASGNPFEAVAGERKAAVEAEQTQVADQFEQNRNIALTERANNETAQRRAQLEAESPGRYIEVDEAELPQWQQQWEEANRSGGVLGDTARILKSGAIGVGQSLTSLADTIFNQLPGGKAFLEASDDIDRWTMGQTLDQRMNTAKAGTNASVTKEQQEADTKNWWNEEKGWFGPAWRDPRSYLRTVGESVPATVVTMAPGGIMARGAYLRTLAATGSERAAAAAAARTATLSGALLEGTMGGADSARNIRDRIGAMPREDLAQADAVKAMIQGGMSENDAINAVTEDAATQAFLVSGVATGMFGGMGDRALAKIIAEGVGGNVAKRMLAGATRGFIGEGILEEAPQGAAQTMAENSAMQAVNPDQNLTEGVGEAVASGIAGGGTMGVGMGAVGGAASRQRAEQPAQTPAAPVAQPRGPIGRSVQHAETKIMERNAGAVHNNGTAAPAPAPQQSAAAPAAGLPEVGATVRIDADGIEPFMGRIDGYEGDEAIVIDGGSGEVYQIPIGNLTQIAKSPEQIQRETPPDTGPRPIDDSIPEFSADPALEPLAPIGGQVTTEGLPPRKEQKPGTERFPSAPQPGERVIVDDENGGRFSAKVKSYENDRTEAVVVNAAGDELQVPLDRLFVSKLSPDQVEAQELKRNPPVEREIGDAGPNSRKVFGNTVVMPDDKHARLFDLGKARFISKRSGESQLDLRGVNVPEHLALAAEFAVSPQDIENLADDYRYRVERAGKSAKSKLPQTMAPVNGMLLASRQNKQAKLTGKDDGAAQKPATWWDAELTAQDRKRILAEAGVKRSENMRWGSLTPAIQNKLDTYRPAAVTDDSKEANSVESVPDKGTSSVPGQRTSDDAAAPPTIESFLKDAAEWLEENGARGEPTLSEFLERAQRASEQEKESDPDDWTSEEKRAYNSGDWEKFSRLRGYSDAEIENFRRYLELANGLIEKYGTDFTAGLEFDWEEARNDADPATDVAANEAATSPENSLPEPTKAQKEAGNYRLGHIKLGGLDISIENPAGSDRKGTDSNGKPWSVRLKSHYGYIRGTVGRDKDHIDVFVKPGTEQLEGTSPVFVVDQHTKARRFDEHKVMLGYATRQEAEKAYLENYTDGWELGPVGATTLGMFKQWLKNGDTSAPTSALDNQHLFDHSGRVGRRGKARSGETETVADDVSHIHRTMADRMSPTEFARRVAASRSGQESAVIEPGGKLLVLKATSNPFGDHAEFFERLTEAGVDTTVDTGYVRITSSGNQIGASNNGPLSDTAAATLKALKTATAREGLTFMGESAEPVAAAETSEPEAPAKRGVTSDQVREVFRSKEFKKAYTDIAATQMGTPHPESPVAYEMAQGWLDQKAGRPPVEQEAVAFTANGSDPIEPYYMGYRAARDGKATVIRASGAAEAYRDLTAPADTKAAAGPAVSANKIFTADAADAARALLRKKLSQLNSGIDPEIMQAGITLAGYHIERGARTFAAYASAMLEDLGESARPYLKSWYMGVKYDPRAVAFDGMSGAAEVDAVDVNAIAQEGDNEPAELEGNGQDALEGIPAGAVPRSESRREAGSGARSSRRTDDAGDRPARTERNEPRGRVADDARDVPAAARDGDDAAPAVDDSGRNGSRAQRSANDASRVKPAKRSIDELAEVRSAAVPAQQMPIDFTISADDAIGQGGAKAKFNGNVAAIKILRQLEAENRPATRDEQTALAKWVGWGGLRDAFFRERGEVAKGWEKQAAELKALLTPEEYSAAESSTRNAHYTSPEIVSAIWDIATQLGFKGGQVLEPSVGAGNFLGLMPGALRSAAQVTGVELDHITGGIAKNLYPTANIQAPVGFEKFATPDGYFDLAIGNPPFGSERLYDKDRRHLNKLSIHNFFFAKSIEALRPGGVLAMVVTNRFLDTGNSAARELIAKQADLIGAIRLPNNAFLKNAGTEVTTDIVILRKRMEGEAPAATSWTQVENYRGKDGKMVPLNRYFIDKPDMMLGDFGAFGTMYGPDEPALVAPAGQDLAKELSKAMGKLPSNVMVAPGAVVEQVEQVADGVENVIVGSLFMADGKVQQRMPDSLGRATAKAIEFPNTTAMERVTGMIRIRDAFARLRRAQIDENSTDERIANLRTLLNKVYDGFTKKHGPINSDANKRLFRDDPTWPQISALENGFDRGISPATAKSTGEKARPATAQKAAIFTKRTQQPFRQPTSASSAKDALAQTLNSVGRVDLAAMSRLYDRSEDDIVSELGPLVYRLPDGSYDTAEAYLSGNVKQKLAEAERAAETDSLFRRNVAALRDVIPADIEPVDIDVKPGAPWVPGKHIEDFIHHITDGRGAKAFFSRANGKWSLEIPRASASADAMWATGKASVAQVLNAVLNGQAVQVYTKNAEGNPVLDQAATDAANEKGERVKTEWMRWLWDNDGRREELSRLYNDTFNTEVNRVYDGSHLTLPGKVSDDIVELRPHQKSYVWRSLQSSVALADHTVGAGKTFALIASAMEKRRLGQARKPMFAVPNHLVGQWAADFVKLYPGAKVLATTKRDFEKENRKRLFARVATGDWDAVIVAHSSFGKIGMSPELEAKFIQQQMTDLESSIEELRRETGAKSRNVAQLTKWRDNLKSKMERLLDAGKKDVGLTFDELGVDALYIDEFHEFKNLPFATGMQRVAGLGNPMGSQKATDMYMKLQHILEKTGGNIAPATGTPLSNTMAEMFTLQRYLDGKELQRMGISHFDAWARVFGDVVTDWELSPSGQYKLNSRFARFVNMPELMARYRSFADVVSNDDIKAQLAAQGKTLPLPKVKGGKPTNVVVERSPDQATYIGEGRMADDGNLRFPEGSLVYRAENLPKKAEKGADNMLKVMSDARKAALDMRLIDPGYGDYAGSKVNRAAGEMKRIYDKWTAKRGIQLVFIDLSTPKKAQAKEQAELAELVRKADEGDETAQEKLDAMSPDAFLALQSKFSVYDDLRQKLINLGVPAAEIAFIHDANTELQKEELFGKVRSGRVRFLFGSTPKMGAGTNVQNRLVALHHLDAPWRPSDLEQRDGRGIRQGNELYSEDPSGFEIEIMRYATKNTLDARQWQGIEAKANFIQQVRKGDVKTRQIEDIAGEAANAAEMKAAASGNPLILEEMETRRKLRSMEAQEKEHEREQHRIKGKIRGVEEELQAIADREAAVAKDAATAAEMADKPFEAVVRGAKIEKPKEFGAALLDAMRQSIVDGIERSDVGSFGAMKLSIEHLYGDMFSVAIKGVRSYNVTVDVGTQEATGLAMQISNTVKRLPGMPAMDAERAAELTKQRPALEKQIGPWGLSQELTDTAAKHRRLIDELKPKAKAKQVNDAATVASTPEVMQPNSDKRPDPSVMATGVTRTLPIPARKAGETLAEWGANAVLSHGRSTGNEAVIAIDDDGSVIEFATGDAKTNVTLSRTLASAMMNPDRRLVVYHNHPRNTPVSAPDMVQLVMPGIYSIWAIGHGGKNTRARLSDNGRAALIIDGMTIPQINDAALRLTAGIRAAENGVRAFLQDQVNKSLLSTDEARNAHDHVAPLIVERAGIIDYSNNQPYDVSTVPGLERIIENAAQKLARTILNEPRSTTSPNAGVRRPPIALRHAAELEGVAGGREQVATEQSGPGSLSEGSTRDYSPKERRRVSEQRVVQELNGKLVDIQPALLKAIPLNYFTELARPNMTAVGDYLRVKRLMDAFRGRKHAAADDVAGDWLKYARLGLLGKDKTKARELSDLMHDTTLAGIDPSQTDEETTAKAGYSILRKRYLAMAPAGRRLYGRVRNAYAAQQIELDDILLDNVRKAQQIALDRAEARYKKTLQQIRDAKLLPPDRRKAEEDAASAYKAESTKSNWAAKARMTKMRIAFESSRVESPYFPLGRFGRYFVTVRDLDGSVLSFSKFEKASDRNRFATEAARDYPTAKVEVGVMEQGSDLRRAMDPRMVAEIEEILGGSGVDPQVMDMIWQRYLETMPDLSTRKRFIHRKGTAGYAGDALRVFSSHMFHAAHQMAKLKYGLELQELANNAVEQAREADDQTRAMTLANELSKRHEWVMNPTGSKAAQVMTSTAFIWFLAASPASAVLNMSQTVMMGLPILGARFGGVTKAAAALAKASSDSVAGRGSVRRATLTPLESAAIEMFYDSGLIDRTQSHDLAGVGETGVEYTPLRARVMAVISWAFHRAEVWNREVTALAAYRLARDAGQDHLAAIDTAHDLTWKTHFDYSNSGRPTVLQNDVAKVALVFRQHNINMLYRVFRDVHQSVKGETPQARREARFQLAGVVGMMSLAAGVTGTIGFNLLMSVAGMLFGDDDDPLDFTERFKADMVDILGPELGGVVLNGVPGHYLGIDLSNRIGMPDLWFRSPTREMQGKQEFQYWLSQTLGATAGLAEQMFVGASLIKDGDVARGVEMMAPKAVRDLMKAYRYGDEGLTTIDGNTMITPERIGWHGMVAQALGFTPAGVSETWDRNTALKNAEKRIMDDRQRLVNKWAMAAMEGDKEAIEDAVGAIVKFNGKPMHAGVPIKKETLRRSIKTRAANEAKREDGTLIRNQILSQRLREALSDRIYD